MSMIARCDICHKIKDGSDGWMNNIMFPYALAHHLRDWDRYEIETIADDEYVYIDLCPDCVKLLTEQLGIFSGRDKI